MKKETKMEKVVRELSDLYDFYRKIPKVQEPVESYRSNSNDNSKIKTD